MKLKIAVAASLTIFAVIVTSMFIANLTSKEQPTSPSSQATNGNGKVALTAEEVAKHATRNDCWIIVSNDVFNVTSFISSHPGGADRIVTQCGKDATQAFNTQGGQGSHSASARSQLQSFKIGSLGSTASQPTTDSPSPTQQSPAESSLPTIVLGRYPNATLTSSEQSEGEQRYIIVVDGQCREVRVKDGSIERDRLCE